MVVPIDRLRDLVSHDPVFGDVVLRAFLIRRSILIGLGVGLRIVGSRFSPDTRRLREFAARNRVPAQWLDLEDDKEAEGLLKLVNVAPEDTPIVILYGRQVLRNPGLRRRPRQPGELQARKFGARFVVPGRAVATELDSGHWTLHLADGGSVTAGFMVIASGASYRRPDVPRLEHFEPVSVFYAASQAEAVACRDDPVAVLGGGNSAGQATVFLSRHAAQVTLVVLEHDLGEHMSRYLLDRVTGLPNVTVLLGTQVRELIGDTTLEAVVVADEAGERRVIDAKALFVFIGVSPSTDWLSGLVALDADGFVCTGQDAEAPIGATLPQTMWRRSALETSQPGVFAVGDVRSGSTKRVAAAVGEGAIAVRLAFERMQHA